MDERVPEHASEHTTAPVGTHRGLEAGDYFVHALARSELAANLETGFAYSQDASARVRQANSSEQDVGASGGRISAAAELAHEAVPDFALDQRDLAPAAAVNTAGDSALDAQANLARRVHR